MLIILYSDKNNSVHIHLKYRAMEETLFLDERESPGKTRAAYCIV